jgi:hypothetical protein
MIRKHWHDVRFWRWWWQNQVPQRVKFGGGIAAVVLVLAAGFFAAVQLSTASAGVAPTGAYTFETTVEKLVTVREHGRTVVKRIPVVRRVFVRPQTAFQTLYDTRVITTPGGVRIVRKQVLVPVIKRHVVTVNGKTKTITSTRLVPTTKTMTQTTVVTNQGTTTVVNNHTDTVGVTVKQTQTQTQTETVTQTQTQTQTETLPPETVTVTVTQDPVTVTETEPAVTVTISQP